jgi:hypothetical protein
MRFSLSISVFVMVHTRFSMPIHVFRAAGEYISKMLCVLPKHGTLSQFSCPSAHAH